MAPVVVVAPPQQPNDTAIPFSVGTRRVDTSRYWRGAAYATAMAAGILLSAAAISAATSICAARILRQREVTQDETSHNRYRGDYGLPWKPCRTADEIKWCRAQYAIQPSADGGEICTDKESR
jgi:hypothetical protein